jgi:dUTP pyrophosphatase
MKFQLDEAAKLPTKATNGSVGFDLFSPQDIHLRPRERISINIGVSLELPPNCFGLIKERSSFAKHFGIITVAGVIDNDFRGKIEVVLWNLSDFGFQIEKGMKIAQLICLKYESPVCEQCEKLNATERGTQGFGSSGLF